MSDLSVAYGWVAGLALIAAMIPHQVRLIRLCCLIAGVFAVLHFAFARELGVGLALALAFVAINGARLYEMWRRARSGAMSEEERELFDHVMQIEDPAKQNRLRDLMVWRDALEGECLIEQGQLDPPLIYIATGRAAIVRDGQTVSECGPGEFIGEMSHISGDRASATVEVAQDMRIAKLDRDAVAQLAKGLPEVGRALDTAFNRSLSVKVLRMNEASQRASGESA